jgi:hypothetical protein
MLQHERAVVIFINEYFPLLNNRLTVNTFGFRPIAHEIERRYILTVFTGSDTNKVIHGHQAASRAHLLENWVPPRKPGVRKGTTVQVPCIKPS